MFGGLVRSAAAISEYINFLTSKRGKGTYANGLEDVAQAREVLNAIVEGCDRGFEESEGNSQGRNAVCVGRVLAGHSGNVEIEIGIVAGRWLGGDAC